MYTSKCNKSMIIIKLKANLKKLVAYVNVLELTCHFTSGVFLKINAVI